MNVQGAQTNSYELPEKSPIRSPDIKSVPAWELLYARVDGERSRDRKMVANSSRQPETNRRVDSVPVKA